MNAHEDASVQAYAPYERHEWIVNAPRSEPGFPSDLTAKCLKRSERVALIASVHPVELHSVPMFSIRKWRKESDGWIATKAGIMLHLENVLPILDQSRAFFLESIRKLDLA